MVSNGLFFLIVFVVVSAAMVVSLFYLCERLARRLHLRRANYHSLRRCLKRTADDAWQSVAAAAFEQELSTESRSTGSPSTGPQPEAAESRDDAQMPPVNIAAQGLTRTPYNAPTA